MYLSFFMVKGCVPVVAGLVLGGDYVLFVGDLDGDETFSAKQ